MAIGDVTSTNHSQDLGENVERVNDDTQFNRNEALQNYDKVILENLEKRDGEYYNILTKYRQYVEKMLDANPGRQSWFFVISIIILVLSFGVLAFVLCAAVVTGNPNIVAIITAATETLVSFLVFPRIIAEYLFNTNENANIKDIVNSLRQHDIKLSEDVRNMLRNKNDSGVEQ